MHQHIGFADKGMQRCQSFSSLEVEHHPQFAAIDAEEGATFAGEGRRIFAQIVAGRWLDLDHFSALIGEQRAAIRPGNIGAQVQHLDPAQRANRP